MKVLVLVLVLANLGVLAWNQWFLKPGHENTPAVDYKNAERLVLVSEAPSSAVAEIDQTPVTSLESGPQLSGVGTGEPLPGVPANGDVSVPADENRQETVVSVANPPISCRSIGPFQSEEEAGAASSTLAGLGFSISRRAATEQRQVGYWVSIPSLADRAAAEELAGRLRASGITDFYIVPSGDDQNAISLGVFTQKERADNRASQVSDNGFTPQVVERVQDVEVTWLDVSGPRADALDAGVLGAGDRPLEIRQACEGF